MNETHESRCRALADRLLDVIRESGCNDYETDAAIQLLGALRETIPGGYVARMSAQRAAMDAIESKPA